MEDTKLINICFSINDEYTQHCGCAIKSIIDNCSREFYIDFYLLVKELSSKNKESLQKIANTKNSSIKFILVKKEDFENLPIKTYSHFSMENYFRIKIPSILDSLDKVLYLDSDLIVLKDISKLWQTDIDNYYLAGCEDLISKSEKSRLAEYLELIEEYKYYNSGVLLINSKKWRDENVEARLYKYAEKYSDLIYIVDQDVLNGVINKDILYLDKSWNMQINFDDIKYQESDYKNANIIHFVGGKKPWNSFEKSIFSKAYFKTLLKTPWKFDFINLHIKLLLKKIFEPIEKTVKAQKLHSIVKKLGKQPQIIFWGATDILKELLKNKEIEEYNIEGIVDLTKSDDKFFSETYKLLFPQDLESAKPDYIIITTTNNSKITEFVYELIDKYNMTCKVVEL